MLWKETVSNRLIFYFLADKSYFQKREFSFTLANDVYVRFLSFSDQEELENDIKKKIPHKIDIGAVYNHMYVHTRSSILYLVNVFI